MRKYSSRIRTLEWRSCKFGLNHDFDGIADAHLCPGRREPGIHTKVRSIDRGVWGETKMVNAKDQARVGLIEGIVAGGRAWNYPGVRGAAIIWVNPIQ